MADAPSIYQAFWTGLLPESNRQTGFRLRHATKRPYVEICRLGFCFRYQVPEGAENAAALFVVARSDGDEIYASLQQQHASIEAAFGGPLRWSGDVHGPWPPYGLIAVIPCPPLRELAHDRWPAVQEQMIAAMVRLEQAVVPHLQPWLDED